METGFEPVYTALQAVASPLGHSTKREGLIWQNHLRADDRARTGDLNLGKVTLYQLSYVRTRDRFGVLRREKNSSPFRPQFKNRGPLRGRRTVIGRSPARRPAAPIRLATKVFSGRSGTCESG